MITRVTDLIARLAKGEGSIKPMLFERDMASHTLEKNIRLVKSRVSLLASIGFKKNSYVVVVTGDPSGGDNKVSKAVSRALARALTASCLDEDLRAMVETHNGSVTESVTFDELVRWMKGEVGGKYPLTSFRDGLKLEFAGKAWTKEVLHLRFAELKQMEARVANTLALYMESHKEYLVATWKSFSPEQEAILWEDGLESMEDSKEEREADLEAQFAEWREGEYAKLEAWVHHDNFNDLLAKAKAEAKAEEEELKAAAGRGQEKGRTMKFAELFSAKTSVLMDRVNEVRKELEERGHAKMRELREGLLEPRGAVAAPSHGRGLQVSVEKLRFQEEDVAACLLGDSMMEWVVLEGDHHTWGERMEAKRPFRLTLKGRSSVYRLCLPAWLRKRVACVNDKRGVTLRKFEFMCRREVVRMEDDKVVKDKPKSKASKGAGAGVGVESVGESAPALGTAPPRVEKSSSASAERKVDLFLEHERHTVAKEKLGEYYQVGRGKSKVEEKREKLLWLVRDAKAMGFNSWAGPYANRLKALEPSTQSAGKGAFGHGKGGGRGGSATGRGGGKGGRGGGKGGSAASQGSNVQDPRRSSRPKPAPGYFKGMQSLTISSDQPTKPTQPPAPHPAYPAAYNPYQHLMPYYPYFNPYAQPASTPNSHDENTRSTTVDTTDKTEETRVEESGVREWDEQCQVETDAEDDPQHHTWVDAESYQEYYGSQSEGLEEEEYY